LIPGSPSSAGIALVCDTEGRILEILSDQLGLAGRFPAEHLFSSCLAAGSLAKSLSFLEKIRAREATFGWELQIAAENGPVRTICFDGCIVDGRLLILGAASSQELLGFLDDLMRIHNEQVNWVRSSLKEMSMKEAALRSQHELYNELTRLNNELANAQRELAKQNFELERLNRLKTQFLGMAAHDLRSPIGHILSFSELLREEAAAALTQEQLEFLSIIRSSSEFMLQLIDDFLDVASIESGNLNLDRRLTDPRKLLEHNVSLNAVLAQKKHIQVALQIEGALPALSLDEGKIEQVLNNLISNAIKFSQPGTTVTVRAAAEGGGVRIAVRDQGPGIPDSERGKLFQPFGKTSVRSTAGESSTGLGLAIVRKIVEGHGGRIWVESQVGVGSVFLFTLPAAARGRNRSLTATAP
jgi:two-component system OmpR family sensor kinase